MGVRYISSTSKIMKQILIDRTNHFCHHQLISLTAIWRTTFLCLIRSSTTGINPEDNYGILIYDSNYVKHSAGISQAG